MTKYEVEGIPDNLPPGTYATKVDSATWVEGEVHIVLKFLGPVDEHEPSLFTITKAEDE